MPTHYEVHKAAVDGPYSDVADRVVALMEPGQATAGGIVYNRPGQWVVRCGADAAGTPSRIYLQVGHARPDALTGRVDWGYGGKAYLSRYVTDSEIVQTIFGLFKAYEEHECREAFLWDGAQIFGPHIDVRALLEVAGLTDARPTP